MKIKTGSTPTEKSKSDKQYEDKLKKETIEKCEEFSKLYFKVFNQLGKTIEGRNLLKAESEKIKILEKDNANNLLEYLEHLILDNHNYEFIVPYYLVSNEIQHTIEDSISIHENHHFGILGDVHEILS